MRPRQHLCFAALSSPVSVIPSLLISTISSQRFYSLLQVSKQVSLKTVFSVLSVISRIAHCTPSPGGHGEEVLTIGTEDRGGPSMEPDLPWPVLGRSNPELRPFPLPGLFRQGEEDPEASETSPTFVVQIVSRESICRCSNFMDSLLMEKSAFSPGLGTSSL